MLSCGPDTDAACARGSVTAIVPNYNHGRYLRERIESVLAQTRGPAEVLVLDDASTDGSRDVIRSYATHGAVRVIENETNSGSPFAQWNRGVNLAKGDYVWIAESDDVAKPAFLERVAGTLDANPGVLLAYCESEAFWDDGRLPIERLVASYAPDARWRQDFIMNGPEFVARYMVVQDMIPNASAVVFRRRAYLAAGPADASLRLCGDWLVWSRICLAGGVAFVAEPLNRFRQHGGTVRASTGGRRELMERLRVIGAIGLEAGATVEALGRAREYQEWLVLRRLSLEWPRPRLPRYARCFAAYARVFGLHGLARFAWLLARHDASVPWKLLAARMGWVDVVC